MKSPQDDKVRMSCRGCKFSHGTNNCEAGRVERFQNRNELVEIEDRDETIYGIKRFCNLYRDEDSDITLKEARTQVSPTFGIAIFDDGDTDSVEKTINSIMDVDYEFSKLAVIISAVKANDVSRLAHLINMLHGKGSKASKLVITSSVAPTEVRYLDCFTNLVQASYLIRVYSGTIFPQDLFLNIDTSLNDNLEKNIFFEKGEIQCVSFKAINDEYHKYGNYDSVVKGIKAAANLHNMVKVL